MQYLSFSPGRWMESSSKSTRTHRESKIEKPVPKQDVASTEQPETQNTLGAPVHNNPFGNLDDTDDYKDESVYTFCGSCKNHVMTEVRFRVGKMTVVSAGILCMFGCAAGCCLIPFMLSRFSDVVHSCPNCQIKLGKYRRKFKHIFKDESDI